MSGGRGGGGDCEPPGSDVESQKSGDQSGKPGNATDGATGTPSSENLGDPSQAAQSVLQVFDLRMGVMRNEFQMQLQQQMQHMQQLHDDHMEKLRADLSRAFNSCTEANNNTQKDVGQLDLRLQRLEFQHGLDMTRISSDFGEFSDVMGGIQEEQIQQAQRLERVEQQLQRATWVQQEGFKPHKSSLKGGKVGPQLPQMTLSPIGVNLPRGRGLGGQPQHPPTWGITPIKETVALINASPNIILMATMRDLEKGDMSFLIGEHMVVLRAEVDSSGQVMSHTMVQAKSPMGMRTWSRTMVNRKKRRGTSRTRSKMDAKEKSQSVLFSSSSDSDEEEEQERGRKRRSSCLPKMQTFDGRAHDWKGFIFNFRQVARQMKWSDREKRDNLLTCMHGEAAAFLQGKPKEVRGDYHSLRDVLAR